jgi:hypothetical protein
LAAIEVVEQPDDVQQRRLAATRRTHDRHELAARDVDVDVVQRGGFQFICTEDLSEVL